MSDQWATYAPYIATAEKCRSEHHQPRLAAAERLAQSVEWLVGMIEKEDLFDAWHQVRDMVKPALVAYRATGQPDLNSLKPSAQTYDAPDLVKATDNACCSEFVTREGREIHENLEHGKVASE